ncbi:MAG: 30S ribosome-binding factor RbfA [Roseiarcus sp.]|jgi:ribosome-binding factor A
MSRSDAKHAGPSHRPERVGETIRHAMAEILQRGEIVDPVLNRQAVTIPSVKMSPDLKLATVAVMPLGGKNAEATIIALKENKKALRALVAQRVNLRFAPDLRFVLDDSFSAQADIDALLKSPHVARDLRHDDREEHH